MAKYKDDDIQHIVDDIEKIRTRPTMYISYIGEKGALHLAKEVINNSIDEATSDKSPCDTIDIIFNENTNELTVIDNGRGIPYDKLDIICSYLQSGSNLTKSKDSAKSRKAGENGVGLTAVNAMSEYLQFIIYRESHKYTVAYDDGEFHTVRLEPAPADKHGTAVKFKPSEKYLGKCKIDERALFEWVNMISYFIDPDLKLTYSYIKKNSDVMKSVKLRHKNGPVDLLDEGIKKPLLSKSFKFEVTDPDLTVVFNYDETDNTDFTGVKSFCNWVNTVDHGVHVNAVKTGFCNAVNKIIPDYMSETEKKKYPITFEDIRLGLHAVIMLFANNPHFSGQTKEKVGNDDLFAPIRSAVFNETLKFFKKNPAEAKKICAYIKKNAKARLEVSKIRKSDYKRMDAFEEATLNGYSPASGNGYKELFIVEGDSAKGGVTAYRDPSTQAVFKIKGNPKNSYGYTVAKILENDELKTLTKIIGGGIGKDFSLKRCNFDKIIILVDSDIDGYNMTSLLCTFFLLFMPELVQDGRLYKALAPLYILKDSKNPYILSKVDYYKLFANKVVDKTKLYLLDGSQLSKKELSNLIEINRDYLSELEPLAQYIYCNPQLIEYLLLNKDCKPNDLNKTLKKKFPELTYDEKTKYISGAINGVYQDIILDQAFYTRSTRLIKLIHEANKSEIYYTMEVDDKKRDVSIGEFFNYIRRFMPQIDDRIKGLGELDGEILWETTLNPKKRTLTQFTVTDIEMELDKVKILHGDKPELRKKFMLENEHRFNRDILDN